MHSHSRRALLAGLSILGAGLAGAARANGGKFFSPAGRGRVDLVYFGQVRDVQGQPLDDVEVVVTIRNLGMTIPVQSHVRGRYRTPDIGHVIKEIGGRIDPAQIAITCRKRGYRQARPLTANVPSRTRGAVEIGFVMARA